jgi:hypothetical protein
MPRFINQSPIVGAFIFPDVWRDRADFTSLISAFRDFGINAVMTETGSYDVGVIDVVHDYGLSFYAGVACFSDHASGFAEITAHPELWPILEDGTRRSQTEWYVGLTPTDRRHQDKVLDLIEAIAARHPIDGLFLDFVRWPLHWEIEFRAGRSLPLDSSFDDATLALFEKSAGVTIPTLLDNVAARAAWIKMKHLNDWTEFKCKIVTNFVMDARKRVEKKGLSIELGAYIVPDAEGMAEGLTGQRLRDLAPILDWVSPMLYHNILLHPPSWIGGQLARVCPIAGAKTVPVLQADSNRGAAKAGDWGPPMSLGNWQAALSEVAKWQEGLSGLIVFPGLSLLADSRGGALRAFVESWRSR